MNLPRRLALASALAALASSGSALAQPALGEPAGPPGDTARAGEAPNAPGGAFELGLGAGYVQGFGDLGGAADGPNTGGGGLGLSLTAGSRLSSALALGWRGQYFELAEDDAVTGTDLRGLATSIEAIFHLAPFLRVNPWVSAGAGYRMIWAAPGGPENNLLTHGLQLARAAVGLEYRASRSFAVGPFLAYDLNVLLYENPEGPLPDRRLEDTDFTSFVEAGIQGRFDFGTPRASAAAGARRARR